LASPPLTTREYAYFKVFGEGSCEPVTSMLNIKPSQCWSEGDLDSRRNKPRRSMFWALESGLDDREPIENHISKLLDVLEAKSNELVKLKDKYEILIQCVGYFPTSEHGFHLPASTLSILANLKLAIDYDFYFVSDYEHELD
jgi:hypothetical protein